MNDVLVKKSIAVCNVKPKFLGQFNWLSRTHISQEIIVGCPCVERVKSLFAVFFVFRTTSSFKGNNWLVYYYAVFEIFSRNAVDGTPVQYGDIVGFKYPFGGSSSWLYRSSSNFYALSCSSTSKSSCATTNTVSGFKIFKKL